MWPENPLHPPYATDEEKYYATYYRIYSCDNRLLWRSICPVKTGMLSTEEIDEHYAANRLHPVITLPCLWADVYNITESLKLLEYYANSDSYSAFNAQHRFLERFNPPEQYKKSAYPVPCFTVNTKERVNKNTDSEYQGNVINASVNFRNRVDEIRALAGFSPFAWKYCPSDEDLQNRTPQSGCDLRQLIEMYQAIGRRVSTDPDRVEYGRYLFTAHGGSTSSPKLQQTVFAGSYFPVEKALEEGAQPVLGSGYNIYGVSSLQYDSGRVDVSNMHTIEFIEGPVETVDTYTVTNAPYGDDIPPCGKDMYPDYEEYVKQSKIAGWNIREYPEIHKETPAKTENKFWGLSVDIIDTEFNQEAGEEEFYLDIFEAENSNLWNIYEIGAGVDPVPVDGLNVSDFSCKTITSRSNSFGYDGNADFYLLKQWYQEFPDYSYFESKGIKCPDIYTDVTIASNEIARNAGPDCVATGPYFLHTYYEFPSKIKVYGPSVELQQDENIIDEEPYYDEPVAQEKNTGIVMTSDNLPETIEAIYGGDEISNIKDKKRYVWMRPEYTVEDILGYINGDSGEEHDPIGDARNITERFENTVTTIEKGYDSYNIPPKVVGFPARTYLTTNFTSPCSDCVDLNLSGEHQWDVSSISSFDPQRTIDELEENEEKETYGTAGLLFTGWLNGRFVLDAHKNIGASGSCSSLIPGLTSSNNIKWLAWDTSNDFDSTEKPWFMKFNAFQEKNNKTYALNAMGYYGLPNPLLLYKDIYNREDIQNFWSNYS